MLTVPLTVRFLVASGTTAALVGCSSAGDSAGRPEPESTSASSRPAEDAARQSYLGAVNALCEDLLPAVVEATHGGSIDVPAAEWVKTWPAHKRLLDGFDADLARVPVPPSAVETAQVLAQYVVWASALDERRIAAARRGETAWRAEVAAEADVMDAPELRALGPAGFDDSCQAR